MAVKYFIAYGIKNDENGIMFHLEIIKLYTRKRLRRPTTVCEIRSTS